MFSIANRVVFDHLYSSKVGARFHQESATFNNVNNSEQAPLRGNRDGDERTRGLGVNAME